MVLSQPDIYPVNNIPDEWRPKSNEYCLLNSCSRSSAFRLFPAIVRPVDIHLEYLLPSGYLRLSTAYQRFLFAVK